LTVVVDVRNVSTQATISTVTTMPSVDIDPGRPNHASQAGSASTMDGLSANAAR